jgi:hypothetical protein
MTALETEVILENLAASQRAMLDNLQEIAARQTAYAAAVHSLIQTHPELDVLANDYLARMDNFAEILAPERVKHVSPAWQTILRAITEEQNRRRAAHMG